MRDIYLYRFPLFENPYPMDLHESPVSCCLYIVDCAHDFIPALYSVGTRQKKTGFSDRVSLCFVFFNFNIDGCTN